MNKTLNCCERQQLRGVMGAEWKGKGKGKAGMHEEAGGGKPRRGSRGSGSAG